MILSGGRLAADGPCGEILADAELLARHDLELPAGFDPARVALRPGRDASARRPEPSRPAGRCRMNGVRWAVPAPSRPRTMTPPITSPVPARGRRHARRPAVGDDARPARRGGRRPAPDLDQPRLAAAAGLERGGAGRALLRDAHPPGRPRAGPRVRARPFSPARPASGPRSSCACAPRTGPTAGSCSARATRCRTSSCSCAARTSPRARPARRSCAPPTSGSAPSPARPATASCPPTPSGRIIFWNTRRRGDLRPFGRGDARPPAHRADARALPRRAPRGRRALPRHRRGPR